jgi:hypothetical protein
MSRDLTLFESTDGAKQGIVRLPKIRLDGGPGTRDM